MYVMVPLILSLLLTRVADMIIDNDPAITRHISVPRDMGALNCSAITAGMVEAVLDGLGFVRLLSSWFQRSSSWLISDRYSPHASQRIRFPSTGSHSARRF